MNNKSTLYWTHLSTYEKCPRQFLWRYGWDQVDFGKGPGNRMPIPEKKSEHHSLMGRVIQAVIEKMYNEEWWRDPKTLTDRLLEKVDLEYVYQERKMYLNYEEHDYVPTREECMQICRDGVTGYVQTMKAHKLLGIYARAEEKLIGWINKWNPVGGIVDVLIRREDTGITLIDGKNTTKKVEGVDLDQLRFYALVFRLAYKQLPDRLGYVWYRFPSGKQATENNKPDSPLLFNEDGSPVLETGIEWIECTEEDIKGIAQRALDAKKGMYKEKFDPKPDPPTCKYCDFESICPERQEQKKANSKSRSKNLDEITEAVDGFANLLLD